ncbi:hypothetical protein L1N85_04280 [Paenibacillus alkaliterrae]|uniref:hypothetical protein n=1 Tax=Paenibacillus alkaliterrae TaxID=320909 RepID=UPI001F452FF1|nr:hypothetical protein [Paenibacillus alkaliterrae]MCF2937651.1 hypothetical protein [Paenibacillus alkaliterrae]
MMKPRVMPIIITAAISASVLFGGWAIYNQAAVAAPLEKAVKNVEGVVSSTKPVMTSDRVMIDMVLEPDANVKSIYETVQANGKDVFGDRKLELNIKAESSKQLEELWSASLFQVAEAMETKAYSDIPIAMAEAAESYKDVSVTTDMDDTNVYITIKNAESVKYVVLPRAAAQLGVW